MNTPIRLQSEEQIEKTTAPEKLHLFPGRAMSEAAFDKSQNYVADRISPLLSGVWPGVLEGLEVECLNKDEQELEDDLAVYSRGELTKMAYESMSPVYPREEGRPNFNAIKNAYGRSEIISGDKVDVLEEIEKGPLFKINKGSAVTENGSVVKLYGPLEIQWSDLLSRSNLNIENDLSGLYMLSLGTEVLPVDYNEAPACRRKESDPTRDTRFETLGYLKLLPVENFFYDKSNLAPETRHKIINRFLSQFVRGENKPVLPSSLATLGLLAIKNNELAWFESSGCRFLSQTLSFPLALLTHTEQVFRELVEESKNEDILLERESLVSATKDTFQALPAAGSLPRNLLSYVANIDAPLPKFEIDYSGLRVDMLPVPVTGVGGIIRRELARGVIEFTESSKERLRLLVAVSDEEYRPDLLDVPVSDQVLSAQVYDYGMRAYDSWRRWHLQLEKLYSKTLPDISQTTAKERADLRLPDLTLSRFNAPIVPRNPELNMQNLPINPADYNSGFFDEVINKRGGVKFNNYKLLPPPYREGIPENENYDRWLNKSGIHSPTAANHLTPGLIIRRAEKAKDIELRSDELDKTSGYIDKINDLLLLQRQQLDAQTVSFATFAGGVAGDGSGLQITRWLPFTDFTPKPKVEAAKVKSTKKTFQKGAKRQAVAVTEDKKAQSKSIEPAAEVSFGVSPYYATFDNRLYESNYNVIGTDFLFNEKDRVKVDFDTPISNNKNTYKRTIEISDAYQRVSTTNKAYKKISQTKSIEDRYGTLSSLSENANKLDQLAAIKSPLSAGLFKPANKDFGVLGHVFGISKEFSNSHTAMSDIQDDIDKLIKKIHIFLDGLPDVIKTRATIESGVNYLKYSKTNISGFIPATGSDDSEYYNSLFKTSRTLIKEISGVEQDRIKLIRLQKIFKEYILDQQKKLEKIDDDIIDARKQLTQLDAERRESLEDYTVAQRLLIEHWQGVEEKFNLRNKTLNSMLGLYYVKVRETATSVTLPDIRTLSYAKAGDLVPGCRGDEQVILADELGIFMDTLLDVPMANWQALSVLTQQLPGRHRLQHMLEKRKSRIQSKQSLFSQNLFTRVRGFASLQRQSAMVLQSFSFRQVKPVRSLRTLQLEVANVLSLEDLQNNYAGGRLRRAAQSLSNNVELACFCLLEKLNDLPPSIRLLWAQLAEDDALPIESPQKWPDIGRAENLAFNSLRTSLELVNWLNRQLTEKSDSDSRSALRNLIRACLMLAASDDPGDLLEGELQVAPKELLLGSVLRLRLNQEAVPGATLQLLDKNKKSVAMLRLDDQDSEGISATVINLFEEVKEVNTQQFMVIGSKYRNV